MSQISGDTAVNTALNGAGTVNRFGDMSTEDFIEIIFTELTNQDPMQPNDSAALLDQLNSIRSIESDIQLTNQLEALVTENQLASASNMLGKAVAGRTQDFDRITGFVVSVLKQGDEIALELDNGAIMPIGNLETVVDPSIFEPAPGSAGQP